MAGESIKEYITPMSKRAAAISTTFSVIYLLYVIGWVDLDSAGKLPFSNLPVAMENPAILFYVAMVASFAMWLIRYDYEQRYFGSIIQERTIATRDRVEPAEINVRDIIRSIINNENTLITQIRGDHRIKAHYIVDKAAEEGVKVSQHDSYVEESNKNAIWSSYRKGQIELKKAESALERAKNDYKEALGIDAGLRIHTQITYIVMPIVICYLAIIGEGIRLLF